MRNPTGIRAESEWTPNASRAGALYLYSTLLNSTSFQDQVPTSLVARACGDWTWIGGSR